MNFKKFSVDDIKEIIKEYIHDNMIVTVEDGDYSRSNTRYLTVYLSGEEVCSTSFDIRDADREGYY